jgi:hypothetical protein
VHALDAGGRILYHFPSTLGSTYDPSPQGSFTINDVTEDPSWHFQPKILEHVPDDKPDAMIPAGPNNAVGLVWMDLSEPHYGIHGTKSPETIGYATSAGCVRLTNWDALFLSKRVSKGTRCASATPAAAGPGRRPPPGTRPPSGGARGAARGRRTRRRRGGRPAARGSRRAAPTPRRADEPSRSRRGGPPGPPRPAA